MENIPNQSRRDGGRHDSEENDISDFILRGEENGIKRDSRNDE